MTQMLWILGFGLCRDKVFDPDRVCARKRWGLDFGSGPVLHGLLHLYLDFGHT